MRTGRTSRADAITNSPIVRSLINPYITLITSNSTYLPQAPPNADYLISTQPSTASVISTSSANGSVSEVQLGKRKRVEIDEMEVVPVSVPGAPSPEVIVNYTAENLPEELAKYWAQRYRLFSLFDEGCQMDKEGWYSVTPEYVAVQIAERCRSSVIVDAFCGVGGNAIQFAFTCEKVIAIDNSPIRLACAKHNAEIYGVADRITFILADFPTWSQEYAQRKQAGEIPKEEEIEVVFLSPPWGGIDYQELGSNTPSSDPATPSLTTSTTPFTSTTSYPLSALSPLPGVELFALARNITPHVAYYLPRNTDLDQVVNLVIDSPWKEGEMVEVEEEWMGRKMKAITCYFGGLVAANNDEIVI